MESVLVPGAGAEGPFGVLGVERAEVVLGTRESRLGSLLPALDGRLRELRDPTERQDEDEDEDEDEEYQEH
jgi:hypothetical protein